MNKLAITSAERNLFSQFGKGALYVPITYYDLYLIKRKIDQIPLQANYEKLAPLLLFLNLPCCL